jgi:predicted transcriptional regulator
LCVFGLVGRAYQRVNHAVSDKGDSTMKIDAAAEMRARIDEAVSIYGIRYSTIAKLANMPPANLSLYRTGQLANPTSKTLNRIVEAVEQAIDAKYRESMQIVAHHEGRRSHDRFDGAVLAQGSAQASGQE